MPGIESAAPERTRDEHRVVVIAELLAAEVGFHLGDGRFDLRHGGFGDLLAFVVVLGTDFGGDGEARGNRDADHAHFGEVRTFAAEQFLLLAIAVGRLAAERVDILLLRHVQNFL